MPTINVYANQTFATNNQTPNANIVPGATVSFAFGRGGYANMFIGFPSAPSILNNKFIPKVKIHVYTKAKDGYKKHARIEWWFLTGNPPISNQITHNNSPIDGWSGSAYICDGGRGGHDTWHWDGYEFYDWNDVVKFFQNGMGMTGEGDQTQAQTTYSANPPYFEITYEPIYYTSAQGYPASGFVNEKNPITLTWTAQANYTPTIGTVCITEAEIAYRDGVGAWVSQIVRYPAAEQRQSASITIPAGTIKSTSFQHKLVRVVSNDGVTSTGFTEMLTLSTVDAVSTAVAVHPLNDRTDISTAQTFTWQHIIATGTAQTKAELQYSVDNAVWTTFFTAQGAAQSCVVAAHTLPAGKLWWRVRTFNSDGAAGAFSAPSAIIGYGAPPAPLGLTANNAARPVIQWQSATQIAYELMIEKSGKRVLTVEEFASTDKRYAVADYLQDGSYTVSVRIKNKAMESSPWSSCRFEIKTAKPTAPVVQVTSIGCGVRVEVAGSYAKTYLLRDGVPIAKFSGTYADYTACGWHDYTVRGVDASDCFADSRTYAAQTKIAGVVIAPAALPSNMVSLPYRTDPGGGYQCKVTLDASLRHYSGRAAPVMHTGGFVNQTIPISFGARGGHEWQTLCDMMQAGETALYRSAAGDCVYGFLQSGGVSVSMGVTAAEMELVKIDYIDQIAYDAPGVV